MKRHLLLLLILSIAISGIARDFTYTYEGRSFKYTVLDEVAKTCQISAYGILGHYDISGALIIPETVSDGSSEYSVTSIGRLAFSGCRDMTEVTIPNSVISIDDYAFQRCSGLTEVTIPNSVTTIGD